MNWSSDWSKAPPIVGESVELSIPIQNQWPRKVKAIRIADLAVHESLPDNNTEWEWQVTHHLILRIIENITTLFLKIP